MAPDKRRVTGRSGNQTGKQSREAAQALAKSAPSRISLATFALFAVAIALLVFAGVGGAQAALSYQSEYYKAQLGLPDIGIALMENGEPVSWRDYTGGNDEWNQQSNNSEDPTHGILLANLDTDGQPVMPGRSYEEILTVRNERVADDGEPANDDNAIPVYVRVKVLRYWTDAEGNKLTSLSPSFIDLNLLTGENWVEDETMRTAERTVLYCRDLLPYGTESAPFANALRISPEVASQVSVVTEQSADGFTTVTTTSDYHGAQFVVEAEVDAVQDHNAVDAIKSAWGVDVKIDENGTLSLVEEGR